MLDWLPWLAGGSTIAVLVLAVLAPSVLQVAAAWLSALSPIVKGVSEALVEACSILWSGIQDILDSWKTIVTVAAITLGAVWYLKEPCPPCVKQETVCKAGTTKTTPKVSPKKNPPSETEFWIPWR